MRYKVYILNYNLGTFDDEIFIYDKTLTDRIANASSSYLSLTLTGLAYISKTIRDNWRTYAGAKDEKLLEYYAEDTEYLNNLIIIQTYDIEEIEQKYAAKNKDAWKTTSGMDKIKKTFINSDIVYDYYRLEEELFDRKLISKKKLVIDYKPYSLNRT